MCFYIYLIFLCVTFCESILRRPPPPWCQVQRATGTDGGEGRGVPRASNQVVCHPRLLRTHPSLLRDSDWCNTQLVRFPPLSNPFAVYATPLWPLHLSVWLVPVLSVWSFDLCCIMTRNNWVFFSFFSDTTGGSYFGFPCWMPNNRQVINLFGVSKLFFPSFLELFWFCSDPLIPPSNPHFVPVLLLIGIIKRLLGTISPSLVLLGRQVGGCIFGAVVFFWLICIVDGVKAGDAQWFTLQYNNPFFIFFSSLLPLGCVHPKWPIPSMQLAPPQIRVGVHHKWKSTYQQWCLGFFQFFDFFQRFFFGWISIWEKYIDFFASPQNSHFFVHFLMAK